jgi:hypothetical protein
MLGRTIALIFAGLNILTSTYLAARPKTKRTIPTTGGYAFSIVMMIILGAVWYLDW